MGRVLLCKVLACNVHIAIIQLASNYFSYLQSLSACVITLQALFLCISCSAGEEK